MNYKTNDNTHGYNDFLIHYGIEGQKWGVRRFQNEDGTLTAEGRTRYGRGKNIDREYGEILRKERNRLEKENQPKIDKLYEQIGRLVDKYELDGDDGGGGNSEKYTDEQLKRAAKKFWDYNNQIEWLDQEARNKALTKAKDTVIKKYGQVGLSEMKHYRNVKSGLIAGTILTALGGSIWSAMKFG